MTGKKATTIKDIAEIAGVSLMTVSAVLSGKAEERRISVSTRDRVREIAKNMDYRANAVARSLRRKSTNVIGVYSGIGYLNAANSFLSELIGGLQEGCDEHHKDLLLHGTFRGLSADDIYTEFADGRLDGLIVQALPADPLIKRLTDSRLPVVAVVDAIPLIPSVVVDDANGMRRIMAHLADRGHRRIVHISPRLMIESAKRRWQAVRESSRLYGIDVCECNAVLGQDYADTPLSRWLHESPEDRPSAITAWSDGIAYEFIAYCLNQGLRVPEDIAVSGFDGIPHPYLSTQRLTSVRAPWRDIGRTAVGLLVSHISGLSMPIETVLPVEFISGSTT